MKVGDYVRTENGIITRIRNIIDYEKPNEKKYLNYNDMCVLTNDWNNDVAGCRGEIIKSSPNIIDLIEVGDYVNGYKVTYVSTGGELTSGRFVDIDSEMDSSNCTIFEEDIKSIVTKEQFESMEYRIGE